MYFASRLISSHEATVADNRGRSGQSKFNLENQIRPTPGLAGFEFSCGNIRCSKIQAVYWKVGVGRT